jgi:putative membrane-bound dehydrogenase-like protein
MRSLLTALAWFVVSVAPSFAQSGPLRVFLRGGPKTHGPGEHDHPRFVEEWKPLLEARGAKVDGALKFPTAAQLDSTDVLVMYAAEGGSIHGEERANLERFLARGGGIVTVHDAVCGDDPHWFKTVVGGAWEHGHSRWHTDTIDLYLSEARHPITDGAANFRFKDEVYWKLHMMPEANLLMVGFHSVFDITPQMWTYEKDNYRSFVTLQGHFHDSFSHDAWRTLLLRGIAWAGKREVDSLLKPGEAAALRYPTGGPTKPDAAHRGIELHPDFELSLAAAEPLVVKPISIDWDPRGRMWVAMTPGYPYKEKFSGLKAHDEIAILADEDGDGRMDSRKTFYKGLDLVTAFVHHRDGVIVGAAPDILWLRDTDGDDQCDAVEPVFTGFGFGDTHAVMSNFRWGPDGWIYATQGYSGGASNHITNAAGRDFGKIGNGLFRFRPDGSAIEIVSSYGSNTWGCSFNEEGELFFTMANGAHLRHVVLPEKFLAGNRVDNVASWKDIPDHDRVFPAVVRTEAPYAQIDFVGGFTAASGSTFYDGGAWPEEWRNSHFVCEPTVNLVHHDLVEPDGVSFRARKVREAEFLSSTDLWFRPVDVRVGPDGALYVLDFYNQAAIHNDTRGPEHGPTNAAIRPDRDHVHGRIWRVQHKQAKQNAVALPLPTKVEEAVALLEHPNAWVRQTVTRTALERGDDQLAKLAAALPKSARSDEGRIAAAWLVARSGDVPVSVQQVLLGWIAQGKTIPRLARGAARILTELPRSGASDWTRLAASSLLPEEPRLRLLTLAALTDSEGAAYGVYEAPFPFFVRDAEENWTRALCVRLAAADAGRYVKAVLDVHQLTDNYLFDAVVSAMNRDPDTCARGVLEALTAEFTAAGTEQRAIVLEALARSSKSPTKSKDDPLLPSLRRLISSRDEQLGVRALVLATRWGFGEELRAEVEALGERLERRLADASQPLERRVNAFEALLSIPTRRANALEHAGALLDASRGPDEQKRALAALEKTDDAAAARALADEYAKFTLEAREQAFEMLLARASWSNELLARIEAGAIAMADLGPQKVHRLRNHPDASVSQRATKLFETLAGASNAQINALIASLLPEVDKPGGDRARGKLVFEQNCASCHPAFGAGGNVGPDLTGIGAHGAHDLLPIIVDPNRAVEAAFAEWIATTVDERNFAGVMVRETSDSIVLRSSAGDAVIAREDIETLRNTGRSPMPAGFESLGAPALRDLIAYLAGDFAYWRVLDLKPVVSSNSLESLYDSKRDNKRYAPARYGVVPLEGVPFEFLDPKRTDSGNNVLTLKGGLNPDWESKLRKPQRVEIRVNAIVQRVHVLGGIAGWGYPYIKEPKPIVKWTWRFADGTSEEHVLHNGVEFADWIGHFDVPGSDFVEGALAEQSWGQLRRFAVAPKSVKLVDRIVLESFDNELAPTFVALTAELPGAPARVEKPVEPVDVLVFGGGSSHDFAQWYDKADLATLRAAGLESARFTASLNETTRQFERMKALVLCTNHSVDDARFRAGLFAHVERGDGLLVLHPGAWFNWADWPEYNARLVGGGSRSHEKLQEFEVRVVNSEHPITRGAPKSFRLVDELYRFERADGDAKIEVLAIGRSLETGAEYPVLWTVERARGRTVGFTLGHDGRAHEHEAFKQLYTGSVRWILQR